MLEKQLEMPRCITPRYALFKFYESLKRLQNGTMKGWILYLKRKIGSWVKACEFFYRFDTQMTIPNLHNIASKRRSPSEILDASSIRQLSRDHHRMGYVVSLLKSLVVSATEQENLLRIRLDAVASKLSRGLSSLPNEILGYIFKFATQHKIKGTRHIAWLSQVSRRFRGIVLGDRSLWSTLNLWYDTTKEEVERIVSRSGEEIDLHIVVNQNDKIGGPDVCTFLNGLT